MFNEISLVTEEIDNAIKVLHINAQEFRQLPDNEANVLFYELLDAFVNGKDKQWWWENFSQESESIQVNDNLGFERIGEIVPNKKEIVWFIVEETQLPFYPIYEGTPDAIQKIIGECYFFEYYIIPKSKEWLLCENHHNYLIGIGQIIIDKLMKYK